MGNRFRERLKEGALLGDGAMGTMLYARGIPFHRCFDDLNLTQPELVKAVHREYVDAGAEVVETNTFGASRTKLEGHGLAARVREINAAGAKLAREAAGERALVAGAIGPLALVLAPVGRLHADEARALFAEQALALAEGGVDAIFLETMPDLAQMEAAVAGVREACDLPIAALMTFTEEGRTIGGDSPRDVVTRLEALEVELLGANCSVGPQPMLEVIRAMAAETKLPLAALPNAGFPRMVEGRYLYLTSPEYLAECAAQFIEAGVLLFGGCCGTTPDHIRAVHGTVRRARPSRRAASGGESLLVTEPAEPRAPRRAEPGLPERRTGLAARLGADFVVSVEVNPPRGVNPGKLLEKARLLRDGGVDYINVADGSRASARMSALALAHLVQREAAMETILHTTCRDRNLLGLQGDLLGAHALGVRNILAVTGDPPRIGDYPNATGVFDVDSIGLVGIMHALNQGYDLAGKEIDEPTHFHIGVGANPGAPDLDLELERLHRKIEAGAQFVMTQPVYDSRLIEALMERMGSWGIPVLMGILPLRSAKHADFLHNEVPGMSVPEDVRERMRRAGPEMIREGLTIAREALRAARHLVQGAYVMPPFGRYEAALEIIAAD